MCVCVYLYTHVFRVCAMYTSVYIDVVIGRPLYKRLYILLWFSTNRHVQESYCPQSHGSRTALHIIKYDNHTSSHPLIQHPISTLPQESKPWRHWQPPTWWSNKNWSGLRDDLQEQPIFHGKNRGFLWIFPPMMFPSPAGPKGPRQRASRCSPAPHRSAPTSAPKRRVPPAPPVGLFWGWSRGMGHWTLANYGQPWRIPVLHRVLHSISCHWFH